MWTTILGTVGGLILGLFLAVIAIADAGGGHGFDVWSLYSSPLWLIRQEWVLFAGIPVMWALLGGLAASARHAGARTAFMITIVLHYAGVIPLLLRDGGLFGGAQYAEQYPQAVTFAMTVYGLGQLALWTLFLLGWLTSLQQAHNTYLEPQSSSPAHI
ncbi:MAG TPA: hypothetical protein VE988_22320 [Gemmataceae bacterium]|nr:hypothetical protein [Gemmataceae bacterium]